MKALVRFLVICGFAGSAFAPLGANAFEIQGEDAELPTSTAEHLGLSPTYSMPQFEGSSLAMPYTSGGDGTGFVSDYGNGIAIPAPGISQPTPAWRSGPYFR
ncbi:hypothetical protein AUC68_03250 [Methyloceanibacter methanicus]|uniref:Uncharacterized protein n=1 Tax=Methyloceanibacter methanicus TaxID=1774968 RepID=A0A1E3W2Y1_9HYPH|nr:hypothetical protein [Methyloceanibacter methanicus]ODS00141.1 hypothetical protein AUC68_03250 [Methyloceanibacter methanicus]